MTNSSPAPLGEKEQAFFEYLLDPRVLTTDLDTASRLLNRVQNKEITHLPSNLELHHIRGAIAEILGWKGGSEIDKDTRMQATCAREWINFMSLTRSERVLNEEVLHEKWMKYGEGKIEGSYEALLNLVREKSNFSLKSTPPIPEKPTSKEVKEVIFEIPIELKEKIKGWDGDKKNRQLKLLENVIKNEKVDSETENRLNPEIYLQIKKKSGEIILERVKIFCEFISSISENQQITPEPKQILPPSSGSAP